MLRVLIASSVTGTQVVCSLGELTPGAVVSFQVGFTFTCSVPTTVGTSNTARVSSSRFDANQSNNTATEPAPVLLVPTFRDVVCTP